MDLLEIRNKIDSIDDKMLELFLERMDLAKEVAKVKSQTNKKVNDTKREDDILYRLASKTPNEFKIYLKELYTTMFSVSKSYQSTLMDKNSKTVSKLSEIFKSEEKEFPISSSVACQGVEGANSGVAAKKCFPICDVNYFKNFEGVFSAVEKGLCEFGVLPIKNSTAGSVLEVYDLMNKYNFYIVRSIRIKINHCLAVSKNATKDSIKKIISHNQALKQCANYLKSLSVETEAVENTGIGAKIVSESNSDFIAAICSRECAEYYGLKIIDQNIEDNSQNYTRFIIISKNLEVFRGSDRISVMASAPHESGSLSKMLSRFSALGLNLTKLESRPIAGSDFEFLFYFDFEGNIKDKGVLNLIGDLENNSTKFTFLGSYKESL